MSSLQRFLCICLFLLFLFSCRNHPDKNRRAKAAPDTIRIEALIKTKQNRTYAVLTDTVKTASGSNLSPYFSTTRYYYDSATKSLFKVEHMLQSITRSVFVAYFDKGKVVKTISSTDMGLLPFYYTGEDGEAKSGFEGQCLRLANKQQASFSRWMRSGK